MPDIRARSPAAERNRQPILEQLQRLLPARGHALEIASGTGQHAAFFVEGLPGWTWQPTDGDAGALGSMAAWRSAGTAERMLAPRALDVMSATWPGIGQVDLVFCANMLHISPWATCAALMQGAARHLAPHGLLVLYGPFRVDGEPLAPSNQAFDDSLRQRNPAWGLRRLADVVQTAQAAGLELRTRTDMPAHNLLLAFGIAAGPAA